MFLIVLFYILCWIHFIYRLTTGGRNEEYGPGVYCGDERCMTADAISCNTVVWGTIGIIVYMLF